LIALVIDGHESHSSHRQRCPGCLERRVQTKNGVKVEYYHRHVTAMLLGHGIQLLLDAEPQEAGENEVSAALRLMSRVCKHYPRAFDVVLADALYTEPRFYKHVLGLGKHLVTVLKENQPTLLEEARTLLGIGRPTISGPEGEIWDGEGFRLSDIPCQFRVVRTREIRTVRRQLTKQEEESESEWLWLTSLSPQEADGATIAALGHSRWSIENQGFNECVNRWHADHVYKHDPRAMTAFWLLCMVAFNLFQAFFARNLKPEYRRRITRQHVSDLIRAELYKSLLVPSAQPP